jgi:hypothetical protein
LDYNEENYDEDDKEIPILDVPIPPLDDNDDVDVEEVELADAEELDDDDDDEDFDVDEEVEVVDAEEFEILGLKAYPNIIKRVPRAFISIFYRALTNIEEIKNEVENENEPQRVWSPLGTITKEYFYRKCRTNYQKA